MPALNRVQLIGYLGKDPETRLIPNGKAVCNFSLAVDRRWKTAQGEPRESTEWFNVEAWGRWGEICQQYFTKGSLAYIEGRFQTDRYERDGDTRYFTKVVASYVQNLDRKPNGSELADAEDELVPE